MRFTKTIASASVAAVLGLAGVSVAGAASTSTSSPAGAPAAGAPAATAPAAKAPAAKAGKKHVRKAVRRRLARHGLALLAAKTIGIPRADFVTELRAGKTIAEIATGHGVSPQTVIDALKAAAHTKIEAAQAANKITAERAARLEKRFDRVIPKFVNSWHLKAKAAQG